MSLREKEENKVFKISLYDIFPGRIETAVRALRGKPPHATASSVWGELIVSQSLKRSAGEPLAILGRINIIEASASTTDYESL